MKHRSALFPKNITVPETQNLHQFKKHHCSCNIWKSITVYGTQNLKYIKRHQYNCRILYILLPKTAIWRQTHGFCWCIYPLIPPIYRDFPIFIPKSYLKNRFKDIFPCDAKFLFILPFLFPILFHKTSLHPAVFSKLQEKCMMIVPGMWCICDVRVMQNQE